nr:CotH kinase family protein [Bacteroidia bacterium]
MKKLVLAFILLSCYLFSGAQTFTAGGGTIPDNGPAVFFPMNISGLSTTVLDSSFGVESVCINIQHNNDYHLTIQLMAPDGTVIDLSMNNGGTGNNYTNTCFTGTAPNSITTGNAPFNGTYRAQGILGNVNNGQNGNGTWYLKVEDHNFGTTGSLSSWSMTFSNTPAFPFVFTSSDLPIVVINTNGQTILDDPKIIVHMGIIDNGVGIRNYLSDPYNNYDGNIGIEIRGSWSQTFPQKQYGFETLNSLNVETDTSILGMPPESDWILNAPYNDKTCMRNVLAYDIANKTGHYASRSRFCELVINNDYKGIYIMLEKIKRDSSRVDISKLLTTDTTGADLTGGYIFKIDKPIGGTAPGWNSQYDGIPGTKIHFQYEYPDFDSIAPQQKTYIRSYVDSFEFALNATWFTNPDSGYKKFIDLQSFVDYFILNETTKNVDAYRNSTFLYKKKITKGNKLFIGPAWDYNVGF